MLSEADLKLIGASDFPMLLGISPWGGPLALWSRLVHGYMPEGTASQGAGHHAEAYNRALYRERTGFELLGSASWRHPMHPWLRCTPDDRALTPDGRRNVELKRYNFVKGWGPDGSSQVPEDIWLQVQVQMGVGLDNGELDSSSSDVSALLRGELSIYGVEHVPEVYERCLALGERFHLDFVLPRRFPVGLGAELLERDVAALHALFPAPTTEQVLDWDTLPPEAQALVGRWLEANHSRKAWAKQEEALAEQVKLLLRDAPGLALPEDLGKRIDFKDQAGASRLDMKALRLDLEAAGTEFSREMLKVLDRYTTTTSTRPLVAR